MLTGEGAALTTDNDKHVALAARGLTKVYKTGEVEVHALRGVDLDLYTGEFVVLLGASGSGKSTLLNIIGGLDVPTDGALRQLEDLCELAHGELFVGGHGEQAHPNAVREGTEEFEDVSHDASYLVPPRSRT